MIDDPAVLASGAVLLAGLTDALVGEPATSWHPVVWFGRLVDAVDRKWEHPRLAGTLAALILPLAAGIFVAGVVALAGTLSTVLGALVAAGALVVSVSLSMLTGEAAAVIHLSDEDLAAARERLPTLVGRDPSDLSAAEVRSAAVESAAENLADGLVAPLLAFTLGATVSLSVAAGLAAWVKAVNTMDSMLGYRSKPTGGAAARLDDAVMFLPARLTALLLAVAAGTPGALVAARPVARVPSSPNSGWPMATLAAVLNCRLSKPGTYDLFPEGSLPDESTATAGVDLVERAGIAAVLLAALLTGLAGGELTPPGLGGGSWFLGGGSWF